MHLIRNYLLFIVQSKHNLQRVHTVRILFTNIFRARGEVSANTYGEDSAGSRMFPMLIFNIQ